MAPFCSFGVAHGGEKTAYQDLRLWFSSPGSPSFGLVWPMPEPATCEKVSPISSQSVEKPNATP